MKILNSFISFFILFIQNELSEAIVGGSVASRGQYPYQVSLQRNNQHFCGGSIINKAWILTAAHCVAGQSMADIRLVAGVSNLQSKLTDDNVRLIAQEYIHPLYNTPLLKDNDLALVKVSVDWKFGQNIGQATLPPATYNIPVGQTVYVTGFGVGKSGTTKTSNTLKEADVQVLDHLECVKRYQGKLNILDNVFCTVHDGNVNEGVCTGDDGGPVTINGMGLVGVIDGPYNANQCGTNDTPDLHIDVAKYRSWIDVTINSNP